ncbi:UNVERIFIED_CONTAM: hypothetical protein K2H54_030529 [Gekko kuhli]
MVYCTDLEQRIVCESTASMECKVKGLGRPPLPGSITKDDVPQMRPARNGPKSWLQNFFLQMLPFEKSAMEWVGKPTELHRGYIFHSCIFKDSFGSIRRELYPNMLLL